MATTFKNKLITGLGTQLAITAVTASSPTTGSVTLTFAAQLVAPFTVGNNIAVSGVTVSGYNGVYQVTGCTTTTVTFSNSTTSAPIATGGVYGTITPNGIVSNSSATSTIIGMSLTNTTADIALATVQIQDTVATTSAYFLKNVIVPPNQSLRIINGGEKLILTASTNVNIYSSVAASLDLVMSWVEIS